MDPQQTLKQVIDAVAADDVVRLRALLAAPAVNGVIDEPLAPFDSPAIIHVRSREALDALLEAGADINARSRWWAGGFGLLDWVSPDLAVYAIERGARVGPHAAARLALTDTLAELLARDPTVVHARGGDGQTPLHTAASIAVADLLLDAGADIDARDVDHESTPAQYMVAERQEIAGHLVARGAHTDLLLAAALGDVERLRRHLDADPGCIRTRVDGNWFPMANAKAGGTIYNWTLGFHASAHEVANRFERVTTLELLFERTPPTLRVVEAAWIGDDASVRRFRAALPSAAAFENRERILVAHAARNNRTSSVRLMLECGLPVDARGQHEATPLHWAAFHGNVDMVRHILQFDPPLEALDADFGGTPLGWAIHGSEHGWYRASGDYGMTVQLLLEAGAKRPPEIRGSAAVREVLQR